MNVKKMADGDTMSLTQTLAIPVPDAYGATEAKASITLRCDLIKEKAMFRLQGEADATLSIACARCLRPVPVTMTFALEERFCENPSEDEFLVADGVIALTDAMTDNLLPQIPAKALCKDDCKGLCPVCGMDWNESSCGCKKEVSDERLAVLKQWFSDETTESI